MCLLENKVNLCGLNEVIEKKLPERIPRRTEVLHRALIDPNESLESIEERRKLTNKISSISGIITTGLVGPLAQFLTGDPILGIILSGIGGLIFGFKSEVAESISKLRTPDYLVSIYDIGRKKE